MLVQPARAFARAFAAHATVGGGPQAVGKRDVGGHALGRSDRPHHPAHQARPFVEPLQKSHACLPCDAQSAPHRQSARLVSRNSVSSPTIDDPPPFGVRAEEVDALLLSMTPPLARGVGAEGGLRPRVSRNDGGEVEDVRRLAGDEAPGGLVRGRVAAAQA